MTEVRYTIPVFLGLIIWLTFSCVPKENRDSFFEAESAKHVPGDWFYLQRAFPSGNIDHRAYRQAVLAKKGQLQTRNLSPWTPIGPVNIGGRITSISVHPDAPSVIFFGAAAGGVFRSRDNGQDWEPVFDEATNLAIGDIAISPDNPRSIYVGTGEANGGGSSLSYDGNGLFHSVDGGDHWSSLGLAEVGGIGTVAIDPKRPERVFVAAMGRLFEKTPDRGIYRSLNGGQDWEKVLFLSDSTGAIDLVIHPQQPDTIYAALWERIRSLDRRSYGGETTGIFRSTDGGDSWVPLVNGLPDVGTRKGRIGLTLSPSHPNILYAIYATQSGSLEGIYKTEDHGEHWTRINRNGVPSVSFMWWFGKIAVDPKDPDIVYVPGLNVVKTIDGGNQWLEVFPNTHVDQHAIWIHPEDTDLIWLGNDGGLFKSTDGGANYVKFENLPISQFYSAAIDPHASGRIYGGTQDNGVMRTPSGLLNDWEILIHADGFTTLFDPNDPGFVLTEYQYGNLLRSIDGGASFDVVTPSSEATERTNWHTPLAMSPHDANIIYYGRNRLFKSTDRGLSWMVISPDLTNGKTNGNLPYGTLTSISISPFNDSLLYTGSDDGNVWHSPNGGLDWINASGDLPARWVTKVLASPLKASEVYATLSGYKFNSNAAHVYKSIDYGQSWTAIDNGLPDIPVNDIEINTQTGALYIATDIGVYFSENDGLNWEVLGSDLPNVVVMDLVLNRSNDFLLAATYGRSMFKYELPTPTATQLPNEPEPAFNIFPNPAHSCLNFQLMLPEAAPIRVELRSMNGQLVKTLWDENRPSGNFAATISIDQLPSGVYFIQMTTGKKRMNKKIIIQ
ncbi:MAG: T9SS type A sorting domain-containing protein [Saprospiraceae bacterium]